MLRWQKYYLLFQRFTFVVSLKWVHSKPKKNKVYEQELGNLDKIDHYKDNLIEMKWQITQESMFSVISMKNNHNYWCELNSN